jgi:hypothetical protein
MHVVERSSRIPLLPCTGFLYGHILDNQSIASVDTTCHTVHTERLPLASSDLSQ